MSDNRWSANRRRFVKAAGAAGIIGLAGCADDDAGADDAGADDGATAGDVDDVTEIRWIMNPAEEAIDIEVQYQPLFRYLESEADVEIVGQPTADYSGTIQELRRAEEDDRVFADTSPGAVAQVPEEIDVTGMRVAFGAEQYFSLITTTPDSGIEELSDLEGETVATAEPTSVSGTLFPLLTLRNAGLDIGSAPGGSPDDFELRTSDHTTAREQMIEDDRIAAAGTGAFSTAAHVPQEQFDEMSQDFVDISAEYDDAGTREPELQLLGVSDPIPRAPIVSNAAWEESIKDELTQLMIDAPQEAFEHDSMADVAEALNVDPSVLDADEDDLSDDELSDRQLVEDHELWFSGVVEASHEDFDPIVELGQELGLDWGDL
ncbi:PhnD/SsuA/transferrin family substrate-binding protein [Halorubrum vacuolatum]|uniref:Phosphonate transport system substrate-binding protein n=1 Tax=Halorubrum vacuolatum TaxID=63740 RepID=A0A238VPT3_HALVU|nr:PhnD/SsuA/transferrin family substrate-binding protein [Halorubrum vacuolatum]SNR36218.1 phosphonate transport system substrate-binding protein [Halorubrum vacuolatum]